MDIKEIKEMKEEIETKIRQMILDFEEKTGVVVKAIFLERQDVYVIGKGSEAKLNKVFLECGV